MSDVTITALGLAALKITTPVTSIYADAFIGEHSIEPFDESDARIILVTHDHGDHFDAGAVADAAKKSGGIVIGPPSITYPLLVDCHLPAEQLKSLYNRDPNTPDTVRIGDVSVNSFATRHFNETVQMTIHTSFLVQIGTRKIYIAGDSYEIPEKTGMLTGLDALVYNYVVFDKDTSKVHELEQVRKTFRPRHFIIGHLVNCEWTIHPDDMKTALSKKGLESIFVLDKTGSHVVL